MFNSKKQEMVRIINYQKRITDEGKEFFILVVQGGIEMMKSQETGKMYVTARRATISSTFDEATCQALIGTELKGEVEKVNCAPYEYTIRETGEIIKLTHRYEFVEEKAINTKPELSKSVLDDFITDVPVSTFSSNGQLVH